MDRFLLALSWILCVTPCLSVEAAEPNRLLRPGDPALQTEHLRPFEATYSQTVAGSTEPSGQRIHRLDVLRDDGQELLRQSVTMLGKSFVEDETVVTRAGLRNRLRRIAAPALLHRVEVWDETTVHGVRIAQHGREAETFTIEAQGQRFAAVPSLVLAALPFREGASHLLASFSTDFGAGAADLVSRVTVEGRETVTTPVGSFPAWKVAVRIFRPAKDSDGLGEPLGLPTRYLWMTDQPPYVVRAEHPSPQGTTTLELVALRADAAGT